MPQSLSFVLVHVIFSTRNRLPLLDTSVRPAPFAYLATIVRNAGCECYRTGGMPDHVHLSIRLSRTQAISKLIEQVKSSSSRWLKTQKPALSKFSWQRGYGAFSAGPAGLESLLSYIDDQESHHQKKDFQEEFRAFLKKYGVDSLKLPIEHEITTAPQVAATNETTQAPLGS